MISKIIALTLILAGSILCIINLYGLNSELQPEFHEFTEFRFENDFNLTYSQSLEGISRLPIETNLEFAVRITPVIANRLAHIEWNLPTDPDEYHQRVPVWENYILYLMGVFTTIPEYKKYHFSNYKRSLQRGIGICGDASMIMSQILDEQKIQNKIISFPGHVIVSAIIDQKEYSFDADFGVVLPFSPKEMNQYPDNIKQYYLDAGFTRFDARTLRNSYSLEFETWNGVSHFFTKKYYFEKLAYALKWPLPLILLFAGAYLLRRRKTKIT
jgi:hypothetical protein